MMRALYSAASGMNAQQLNMDTISNNLANVNTYGYKKARAEFKDLLYANLRNATAQVPTGMQVGSGVRPSSITIINTGGSLINTGNPTDVAVSGEGYFRVVNPADDTRPYYTRDGSFKLDAEGYLVNGDGLRLDGVDPIPPRSSNVNIDKDGQISYVESGAATATAGSKLQLYTFPNPAGLERKGGNLLMQTDASGEAGGGDPNTEDRGGIVQGFLEASNVQVVEEMVAMITAQRAYEVSTKAIQTSDEMMGQANTLKR
ncbi:flagellar basal-body rod protein FlgG [Heliophilum fasciatum]|uniref:Flagellar basal-body rod protein FlgG n=1 Tax=Heliophilum fasciatum TaxID=35700 RepID=A0A4R2RQ20_9FIRM|nr:flagellar basal-body rod protein FlgG [Heliophilum fasciatum]MCW2277465.1 flagellar basal-body rod protein FlgG [Heliophilum fasciatum]TCP65244.1 flagellar basal-body rod protein FlgG [Heliophilum fasciatum]